MFDVNKKNEALAILSGMCLKCEDKHLDECLLAKAIAAVKLIPTT